MTPRRLMILEQLVTAGTITEFEIWKLRRKYRRMVHSRDSDPEAGLPKLVSASFGESDSCAYLKSGDIEN